jgi:hypothetical protein
MMAMTVGRKVEGESSQLRICTAARFFIKVGLHLKMCANQLRTALSVAHPSHWIFDVSPLPKRQASNEGLTRYVGTFLSFWSPY